jgi:hypothetical protein
LKPEDRVLLKSGKFDREAWAALSDRLPESMRRKTVEFVLHKLHAIESGGRSSTMFTYETSAERAESGAPIYEDDQPGDVVTFQATFQFGNR